MGASVGQFNAFKPASVSDYANTSPQSYASMGCGIPPQQNYQQPMAPSSPASGGQCDKPGQQESAPQMGQSLFDKVSGGQMANINDPAPSGPAPWMSGGFGGTSMPELQRSVLNPMPQQGATSAQPSMSSSDLLGKINGGQQMNINDPAPTGPAPWMSGGFGGMPLPQNFQPAVLNQIPQQGQAAAQPNLLNPNEQATFESIAGFKENPGNPQGKPMTELDKQELLKKISAGQMAWL